MVRRFIMAEVSGVGTILDLSDDQEANMVRGIDIVSRGKTPFLSHVRKPKVKDGEQTSVSKWSKYSETDDDDTKIQHSELGEEHDPDEVHSGEFRRNYYETFRSRLTIDGRTAVADTGMETEILAQFIYAGHRVNRAIESRALGDADAGRLATVREAGALGPVLVNKKKPRTASLGAQLITNASVGHSGTIPVLNVNKFPMGARTEGDLREPTTQIVSELLKHISDRSDIVPNMIICSTGILQSLMSVPEENQSNNWKIMDPVVGPTEALDPRKAKTNGVQMIRTDMGIVFGFPSSLISGRHINQRTHILAIDIGRCRVKFGRKSKRVLLSPSGDAERAMVVSDASIDVTNDESSGIIWDVRGK